MGGPWGWESCTPEEILTTVVRRLHAYEERTWGQLLGDTLRNHQIPTSEIVRAAQRRLQEAWGEDLPDHIYSLAVDGKKRIWGIKQGTCYRVLWWDPDHEIYPVEKRRT